MGMLVGLLMVFIFGPAIAIVLFFVALAISLTTTGAGFSPRCLG
jgi:hypothetical protein